MATVSATPPDRQMQPDGAEAEPAGEHVKVEVPEQREGHDLEQRVDRHQHSCRLPVPAGQVVPDQDHGDAASEADDDQPGPVGGKVGQQQPGEREHDGRADDPVEHQRRDEHPSIPGDGAELVVAQLGEHRVHHDQQTDEDRQRRPRGHLDRVEVRVQAGDGPPEPDARRHRQDDPYRQEPVEERQAGDDGCVRGRGRRVLQRRRLTHGGAGRRRQQQTVVVVESATVADREAQHAAVPAEFVGLAGVGEHRVDLPRRRRRGRRPRPCPGARGNTPCRLRPWSPGPAPARYVVAAMTSSVVKTSTPRWLIVPGSPVLEEDKLERRLDDSEVGVTGTDLGRVGSKNVE